MLAHLAALVLLAHPTPHQEAAPLAVVAADEPDPLPGRLEGRVTRVQAYKNGVSLVSMRLAGTADADGALSFELPDAQLLLGGVWIEGERAPRRVEAGARERETTRPCRTLFETLEVNIGRRAQVAWHPTGLEGPRAVSNGTIRSAGRASVDARGVPLPQSSVLVLERADGSTLAIPTAYVVAVEGTELVHTVTETEPGAWTLDLVTEANAPFECRLEFLARGIEWRAVYRLVGDLEGSDDLTVSYELSNELVDLDGTVVHLVAGEANFTHDGTASFLSSLTRSNSRTITNLTQQQWGQMVPSNNAFSNSGTPMTHSTPASGSRTSAEGDLTRLPLGEVTLARGGRALVRANELAVGVGHLYTLDLDVRRGSENGVEFRDAFGAPDLWEPAYRGAYVDHRRSKAWHRLTLGNSGALPWTTGPVLVVRALADGPFPLAQETLRYTPAGDTAEVPLNLALGVETDFWERSIDASTVEGRLEVTNRIGEAISLRARIGLGGRVTITEGDATVAMSPGRDADWTGMERSNWRYQREVNPHAEIEWTIDLEPGATVALGYRSTFDVSRR